MSAPGDFVPTDGCLAAVEWIEADGGDHIVCHTLAVWRHGEWWPNEGGGRLLGYEGNRITAIWPLTDAGKISIPEEEQEKYEHLVWDPKVKHKD